MKKLFVIFAILFLFPIVSLAANHCVSPTGTGTESGDDWDNTLGWDALSVGTAFTRGDTYYLADGSYGSKTLDDAASGAAYIYIKKATESSHGIATGWASAYGDGIAEITAEITFSSDYWDVDGEYGSLDNDFGIRISRTASDGKCVRISDGTDYVLLTYIELENAGYSSSDYNNADCLYALGNSSGSTGCSFTSCWFHNANRTAVWLWGARNYIWDGCWFTEIICMDFYGVHGEAFSINQTPNSGTNTIKNSLFRNIEGSAYIGFMNSFGDKSNYNWDIYNTLFYVDGNHILDGYIGDGQEPSVSDFTGSNSVIDILSDATGANFNIFGNTFANMQQNAMVTLSSGGTNNIVRNNFFVHASRTGTFVGTTTSNTQSTTDTTYVTNYATFDLTLAKATNEGYTLGSPYNMDRISVTRGDDDFFDIGAYEYESGPTAISRGITATGVIIK